MTQHEQDNLYHMIATLEAQQQQATQAQHALGDTLREILGELLPIKAALADLRQARNAHAIAIHELRDADNYRLDTLNAIDATTRAMASAITTQTARIDRLSTKPH